MSIDARPGDVLASAPPDIALDEALEIAARTFRVEAAAARDLGSERDRTFLLLGRRGACHRSHEGLQRSSRTPTCSTWRPSPSSTPRAWIPDLPLALPWPVPGLTDAFRASVERSDGRHAVRMYDVLPGHRRSDPRDLSDAALAAWGETTARLGRALRGFFHPRRAAHVALGHPARRADPGAERVDRGRRATSARRGASSSASRRRSRRSGRRSAPRWSTPT